MEETPWSVRGLRSGWMSRGLEEQQLPGLRLEGSAAPRRQTCQEQGRWGEHPEGLYLPAR